MLIIAFHDYLFIVFPILVYAEYASFPLTVTWPKEVYINGKLKYYKTCCLQSRLGRLLG